MKKIEIKWDSITDLLRVEGASIHGTVTIWEGESVIEMSPARSLRVAKDRFTHNFKPEDGKPFMPEISESEREVITTMIDCFYSGLVGRGYCYQWLEIK